MIFYVYKNDTRSNKGIPDCTFLHKNITFLVEFKKKGGKLSALQVKNIKQLRDLDIKVIVIDNVKEGKAVIDILSNISL